MLFDKLTPDLKDRIAEAFMNIEKQARAEEDSEPDFKDPREVGEVKWTIDSVTQRLPLYFATPKVDSSGHVQSACLARFTDGNVGVIVSLEDFVNNKFLTATIAHEVGHYIHQHFQCEDVSLPNLYKENNLIAYLDGDQDTHDRITSKSIIDGGYLDRELEADVIAVKFVGVLSVIALHTQDAVSHFNPLSRLEKLNRVAQLYKLFVCGENDYILPQPGWELSISLHP